MLELRHARWIAVAAALAAALAAPAHAVEIELVATHFVSAQHGVQVDMLEPWAAELERRTGGRVHVTIHPGGSALGNINKQYDQVRAGVTDIAFGLNGIPRGRFPRTSIMALPFMTASADAATRALWDVFPEYLAEEYPGVHVLALTAHNGGMIHTVDKKVTTAEDLAGLRIRAPSPEVTSMLEYLGASPVGMPPGEVYESLQRGVLDGAIFPWDPVKSMHIAEVVRYHLEIGCYTVPFYLVINERRWQGLPAEVRQAIDDISGPALIEQFGGWWDKWDAAGRAAAVERGNVISTLSDAERAAWRLRLEPMIEAWLAGLEDQGVDNAREIYDAMRARIVVHEATH